MRKSTAMNKKTIIVFVLGFGMSFFLSSCPSSPEVIGINYNNINITGIDNSTEYLFQTSSNSIHADALALKLTLSETSIFQTSLLFPKLIESLSFQTAYASSPADPIYIPLNKVVAIKIKTLFDIDDSLSAGDDVSAHFLCSLGVWNDLYHNLNQGVSWLNSEFNNGDNSIVLVLKKSVKNRNAQFEIEVTLDNGKKLLAITEMYTIYNTTNP